MVDLVDKMLARRAFVFIYGPESHHVCTEGFLERAAMGGLHAAECTLPTAGSTNRMLDLEMSATAQSTSSVPLSSFLLAAFQMVR